MMWRWIAIGSGVAVIGLAALLFGMGVFTPYLDVTPPNTPRTSSSALDIPVASAPTASAPVKPAQAAWVSRCTSAARSDAADCTIEQRIIVAQTRQLLAGISISVNHADRKPAMMLQAPIGLYLPAGVTFQLDKAAPQTLPLQTCDGSGCYAGSPVSDELLRQFQSGQTLTITFQNLNKQDIKVQMPVSGFSAAFDRVK